MDKHAPNDLEALDAGWEDEADDDPPEGVDDPALDELDAGWDVEEERAVAADIAAGLDATARREAAEERARLRKEKRKAKKLAAREKRRAQVEAVRQRQKKPKRRSQVPPSAPRRKDDAPDRATAAPPRAVPSSPARPIPGMARSSRRGLVLAAGIAAAVILGWVVWSQLRR